jgi:hypothetical protein
VHANPLFLSENTALYTKDIAHMFVVIVQGFRGKTPKERDHSKDRGVDGRTGSEWILGRLAEGDAEWTFL